MRRLLPPIAALSLVVAGCGDDGPDIDPEADEELIEDAILTLDDLPDGFEERDVDDDDDDQNECNEDVLGIDPDELDEAETARVGPVAFETRIMEVRAEITAFRDTDLPERVLDGIGDDEYVECLADRFTEDVEDGELDELGEIDSPVDGGRALAVHLTLTGPDGEPFGVDAQQHAVLVDRFGITLQVTALGGELDEDLAEDLLETMVDRIEDEVES